MNVWAWVYGMIMLTCILIYNSCGKKITNVSQIVETNDCTFQVIVFAKPSEQPIDNMTISHAKTR